MKHRNTHETETLFSAGELLSYAQDITENPVGHLDLLEQAAISLLFIHPPVLMRMTDGDPVLVGDPEMTAGLLRILSPNTQISVRWWPERQPFRVKTNFLLKTTNFAERCQYLRPLLPILIKSSKRNKDVARAMQVHPSQISRGCAND